MASPEIQFRPVQAVDHFSDQLQILIDEELAYMQRDQEEKLWVEHETEEAYILEHQSKVEEEAAKEVAEQNKQIIF